MASCTEDGCLVLVRPRVAYAETERALGAGDRRIFDVLLARIDPAACALKTHAQFEALVFSGDDGGGGEAASSAIRMDVQVELVALERVRSRLHDGQTRVFALFASAAALDAGHAGEGTRRRFVFELGYIDIEALAYAHVATFTCELALELAELREGARLAAGRAGWRAAMADGPSVCVHDLLGAADDGGGSGGTDAFDPTRARAQPMLVIASLEPDSPADDDDDDDDAGAARGRGADALCLAVRAFEGLCAHARPLAFVAPFCAATSDEPLARCAPAAVVLATSAPRAAGDAAAARWQLVLAADRAAGVQAPVGSEDEGFELPWWAGAHEAAACAQWAALVGALDGASAASAVCARAFSWPSACAQRLSREAEDAAAASAARLERAGWTARAPQLLSWQGSAPLACGLLVGLSDRTVLLYSLKRARGTGAPTAVRRVLCALAGVPRAVGWVHWVQPADGALEPVACALYAAGADASDGARALTRLGLVSLAPQPAQQRQGLAAAAAAQLALDGCHALSLPLLADWTSAQVSSLLLRAPTDEGPRGRPIARARAAHVGADARASAAVDAAERAAGVAWALYDAAAVFAAARARLAAAAADGEDAAMGAAAAEGGDGGGGEPRPGSQAALVAAASVAAAAGRARRLAQVGAALGARVRTGAVALRGVALERESALAYLRLVDAHLSGRERNQAHRAASAQAEWARAVGLRTLALPAVEGGGGHAEGGGLAPAGRVPAAVVPREPPRAAADGSAPAAARARVRASAVSHGWACGLLLVQLSVHAEQAGIAGGGARVGSLCEVSVGALLLRPRAPPAAPARSAGRDAEAEAEAEGGVAAEQCVSACEPRCLDLDAARTAAPGGDGDAARPRRDGEASARLCVAIQLPAHAEGGADGVELELVATWLERLARPTAAESGAAGLGARPQLATVGTLRLGATELARARRARRGGADDDGGGAPGGATIPCAFRRGLELLITPAARARGDDASAWRALRAAPRAIARALELDAQRGEARAAAPPDARAQHGGASPSLGAAPVVLRASWRAAHGCELRVVVRALNGALTCALEATGADGADALLLRALGRLLAPADGLAQEDLVVAADPLGTGAWAALRRAADALGAEVNGVVGALDELDAWLGASAGPDAAGRAADAAHSDERWRETLAAHSFRAAVAAARSDECVAEIAAAL